MNKYIISTLLIILSLATLTTQQTCGAHPLYSEIRAFIEDHEEYFEEEENYSDLIDALDTFESSDPAEWESELADNVCPDFDGELTCCTDALVETVPHLLTAVLKKREEGTKKPKIMQFLRKSVVGIKKCGGKALSDEFEDSDVVKDVRNKIKECRTGQYDNHLRFLIENLCTLCFNPEQILEYFDGEDRLIVSAASLEELDNALQGEIECQREVMSELAEFTHDFINENLDSEGSCDTVGNGILKTMNSVLSQYNEADGEECAERVQLLTGGNPCQDAIEGEEDDVDIEGESGSGNGNGNKGGKGKRRKLSTGDVVVSEDGGYVVYDGSKDVSRYNNVAIDTSIESDSEYNKINVNSSQRLAGVGMFVVVLFVLNFVV